MDLKQIKKVSVFDFDDTLIDTMEPEEGKKVWKAKTGEVWPYKGWWGRKESLDLKVFPSNPHKDMLSVYKSEKARPNTFVALCTGRHLGLTSQVNAILSKHGLTFDEIVLNGDRRFTDVASNENNTLAFKVRYFTHLIRQFPNIEEMEIWDDRDHHHPTFVQWSKMQKIPVTVHHVKR